MATIIPDNKIDMIWNCDKCGKIVKVNPPFYQDSGTPVCDECDEDMTYMHTEINP